MSGFFSRPFEGSKISSSKVESEQRIGLNQDNCHPKKISVVLLKKSSGLRKTAQFWHQCKPPMTSSKGPLKEIDLTKAFPVEGAVAAPSGLSWTRRWPSRLERGRRRRPLRRPWSISPSGSHGRQNCERIYNSGSHNKFTWKTPGEKTILRFRDIKSWEALNIPKS